MSTREERAAAVIQRYLDETRTDQATLLGNLKESDDGYWTGLVALGRGGPLLMMEFQLEHPLDEPF